MFPSPGAEGCERLIECSAQGRHHILDAGRCAVDKSSVDDAVALQPAQTLGQGLLRHGSCDCGLDRGRRARSQTVITASNGVSSAMPVCPCMPLHRAGRQNDASSALPARSADLAAYSELTMLGALLAWEDGSGRGHVVPLRTVAEAVRDRFSFDAALCRSGLQGRVGRPLRPGAGSLAALFGRVQKSSRKSCYVDLGRTHGRHRLPQARNPS